MPDRQGALDMAEGVDEREARVGTSAVFISYASQDAAAAARICSALRQAGAEVWFDQSELRGGDVWDQKIRREIRDCTLFMPVISANTASRHEGYFRLEWDLADQRTHMMARDRAFIVPVCLDATKEAGTDVPESFHRVQWTRLLDGTTPPAFTARIVALLGAPGAAASASESTHPAAKTGFVAPPASTLDTTTKSTLRRNRLAIALATIMVILAYVAVDRLWLSKHTPAEKPAAAVAPAPIPATPAIPEKSVAVLPFVDMSEKKDQEYFSDGLSEELIDMLTKVPELRVPARTSSFSFKGKQATIADIAKALSVANVLEGSVRKSGNHLRITAQLVRADSGYHLWSETYDRQLDDIFKVQDEIAGAVVKALKISLIGGFRPESTGTRSVEAYSLYLQARSIIRHAHGPADSERAVQYLRKAVEADPQFANGWALLAIALTVDFHVQIPGQAGARDNVPADKLIEEARRAAKEALRLSPNLPEPHLAAAAVLINVELDVRHAEAQIKQALELDPNSPVVLYFANGTARIRGQFDRAIELIQKSIALDPVNPLAYDDLATNYYYAGRYSEALAAMRRKVDLDPGAGDDYYALLAYVALAKGDPAAALTAIDSAKKLREQSACLVFAYDALGRKAEADAALTNLVKHHADDNSYGIGLAYANRGELDQAFKWFDRTYQQRNDDILELKVDPRAKNVRSDPRFKALLRKLNLLD
jgi:TolB-like protein/cytochrome c-type biogenesis protein CcmH/NrfG